MRTVETVTPKRAQELLQNQTPQDAGRVAILCRKMQEGDWKDRPPIRINRAGRVADGVHRLAAVIRYGKPVQIEIEREL